MLQDKRIILGVTGSIAAYKAAFLVRELRKRRCWVQVVMTRAATRFITPLTLQTLSRNPVLSENFPHDESRSLAHIELARKADLILIAPASANTIAKLAVGMADNLLTCLCLAACAPLLIAPAMNSGMYLNPALKANIAALQERGVRFVAPASGELACGEEGPGRLAAIEQIIAVAQEILAPGGPLAGERVMISAGPTREPIDEVRFISNRSSGRMGYALAEEARRRGARVILVSGPTALTAPQGVDLVRVQSARQMQAALQERLSGVRVLVMCAAVSDYAPAVSAPGKMKKSDGGVTLRLEPTPDILAQIGRGREKPLLVGFAAESAELEERARRKLAAKGLDLIVANHISYAGAAQNEITIIDRQNRQEKFPPLPKSECAGIIWDRIEQQLIRFDPSPRG